MSLDEIAAILAAICGRFDADISLEGGEPFLRVGIDRMLSGLDTDVLRALTVTTNGTVAISSAESVLRSLGMLRISIDGHMNELNQELRGVELAPILHTCRTLQKHDVPFAVRMTLWKRNIRLLHEIYDWIEENSIERLSLFEYQSSGRGIGQDLLYGVSGEDVEIFLERLAELPRPSCLRHLTVNFAERRLDAVLRHREQLDRSAIVTRELPSTANCTINYDGTVGISPWRVTAYGAADVFTTTGADDFLDTVEAAAGDGALNDDSGSISRVQLCMEHSG
jgi:MoaA/NifB/PqqE/SkfB family radical SAM enzyme